jgi:hypothetical protein
MMFGYPVYMGSDISAYSLFSSAFGLVLFADLMLLGIFLMLQVSNKK